MRLPEFDEWPNVFLFLTLVSFVAITRYVSFAVLPSMAISVDRAPTGYLEGAWPNGLVTGWALDQDTPDEQVDVHFYIDGPAGQGGKFIGLALADIERTDVNQVMRSSGPHGFEFIIPTQYRDGLEHKIFAYGINTGEGENRLLIGSPKSITLIGLVTGGPTVLPPSNGGSGGLATAPAPGSVELVGSPETVFDYSASHCVSLDIPDAPARAFRDANGRVNLIASHYISYRMLGSTLDNVKRDCGMIMNSANDPDFYNFTFREWITAPYTLDGNNVYALVHNEWYAYLVDIKCREQNQGDGWINTITMVQSSDAGARYSHSSTYVVAEPALDWDPAFPCASNNYTRFGPINPSNIFQKDGYYYAFYQSERDPKGYYDWGACMMRTKDVSSATAWQIYTEHGWDDNPTASCQVIDKDHLEKIHESITYNNYLKAYVLVGMRYGPPGPGIYYAISNDLLHWSTPVKIMGLDGIAYPSLIDPTDASRNFEYSNREPYIYYTRFNNGTDLDRDLVRQKIRFTAANAPAISGTPLPTSTSTPAPTQTAVPFPTYTFVPTQTPTPTPSPARTPNLPGRQKCTGSFWLCWFHIGLWFDYWNNFVIIGLAVESVVCFRCECT